VTGRAVVYGMLAPAALALAALAAMVCTSSGQLTWTQLGISFGIYLVVNIGAAIVGAHYANRQ